jgi:hypothetical protein
MARFNAVATESTGQLFDAGFGDPDHELHALAMDGVSCTLCHQIEPEGLGQPASFSGAFVINPDLPQGERLNYGPFPVDEALGQVMQQSSGFLPVQSDHIRQATFCSSCHTLYTPTVDRNGEVVGQFPEQTPFLEWQHSDYQAEQSCQNCHMPAAQGAVPVANIGGQPHSPFSRHVFVGGNVYGLQLLQIYGQELGVTADPDHFQATIERTLDQLQNWTASLTLQSGLSDNELITTVKVDSQTGHKFPTGFPARRAWLHLVVEDSSGQVVFESGRPVDSGAIHGNDNDADPATFEPHYQTITRPEQVQIYESIIGDTEEQVTTTLLHGAGYLKDNRLLPAGFDKASAPTDIAVQGQAAADPDMVGGSDTVEYRVAVDPAAGPFTVTVELLYQSIGYRWTENLRAHQAAEISQFLDYVDAVPNRPVQVAHSTATVE